MEDVFCEILKGNIPAKRIYENNLVLAILDISQATYGHTLVIPKKHYRNILEVPEKELGALIGEVKNIAENIIKKLNAKGFNLLVNTNEEAGQTVPHLHFHILPRYGENDDIVIRFVEHDYDLDEILRKLK